MIWGLADQASLSAAARDVLEGEASVLVSAVSAYEVALKHEIGRLEVAAPLLRDFEGAVTKVGFAQVPVTIRVALAAGRLPLVHRDPFDRMLAAQAIENGWTLLSKDRQLDAFGVRRLW